MLQVVVLRDGKIVSTLKVNYEPSCVAIGTSGHDVVVGSGKVNCTVQQCARKLATLCQSPHI